MMWECPRCGVRRKPGQAYMHRKACDTVADRCGTAQEVEDWLRDRTPPDYCWPT